MTKLPKEERVCVCCEYYDGMNEKSWCRNPRGAFYGKTDYHVADLGCSRFKEWKDLKYFDAPKKPLANDYVPNPWREWERKAYLKGSIHE
jgi:hypothetical protein